MVRRFKAGAARRFKAGVLDPIVASASAVVVGNKTWAVNGAEGTYPTTFTSKAEQLADDRAVVLASVAYILSGHSILAQTGTFDLAAAEAAAHDAGAAEQYASDQDSVEAIADDYLVNTITLLGIAGGLDMSLYMELLVGDPGNGPLTGSIMSLERMLSYCPAFWTRVEADSAESALEHIRLYDYEEQNPSDLQRARPFAAIWPADRLDLEQAAGGQRIAMTCSGELVLLLTDRDRYPGLAHRRESGMDFAGWIDQVILWLKDHSNESDFLTIRRISFLRGPVHSPTKDEKTEGAYWHCALLIDWN